LLAAKHRGRVWRGRAKRGGGGVGGGCRGRSEPSQGSHQLENVAGRAADEEGVVETALDSEFKSLGVGDGEIEAEQ